MPVSNPSKIALPASVRCGDLITVTLSFDAEAELKTSPADIVLMMDRSGSLSGAPLTAAKTAARDLIATVSAASGSTDGLTFEGGTRMGLVSFADTATEDLALGTDAQALEGAVSALNAGGLTNHTAAFEAAGNLLAGSAAPRRVAILFTDGVTTVGGDADPAAQALRQAGVEVYCIGLLQDDAPLRRWATDPDATHVSSTDDLGQLQRVFAQVAAEVVQAGALDMKVREVLSPEFKLVRVLSVSHGSAAALDARTLEWTADAVGAAGAETAALSFEAMHVGTASGTLSVNESADFADRAGSTLTFPDPQVEISCGGTVIQPEACPLPATFLADSCHDAVSAHAPETSLSSLGRIVRVDATVKNVCPGRQVAVAVVLTELDETGVEHPRGTKTLLIPPQSGTECRDVELRCIHFVVPESLSPAGGESLCSPRGFRTRVLANYVDTDFVCCDPETAFL